MAIAAKPWTTGTSGTSSSLRRRLAWYGLASRLAIISSVTVNGSGSSPGAACRSGSAGRVTSGLIGYGVHRVTMQMPRVIAVAISRTPTQASVSTPLAR